MTDPRIPNTDATDTRRAAENIVEEVRVPLIEERVVVDKRERLGKTVTVRTVPVSQTQTISEELQSDTVEIRRVPIDRVIDAIPEAREEDGVTIMPVVEERLVVTKQLVLVEEIHLSRKRETRTETQDVELSRTQVAIDETDPE